MKRSLGTAELPVLRTPVPDTEGDPAPPVEPTADAPAAAPNAEQDVAEDAPMAFPGPFAYIPRPTAMEGGDLERGSASSEPAPAAGRSTNARAASAITHPTAGEDNPLGYPPLILAASKGRLAEVELLLKNPAADIDQLDPGCGMNALIAASLSDKPEVVAQLLAAGAKVNVTSYRYKATALMLAAQSGYIDVVEALLTREGVLVDASIAGGPSALVLAAMGNHPAVVKRLLDAGAAVNFACTTLHQTALFEAAYRGYVEVAKALLASPQLALDATNVRGSTALHIAACYGKTEVVACLLEAGASVTIRSAQGRTPLDQAILQKQAAAVEVLLQHGAVPPKFDCINTSAEPAAVAFAVTLADLIADRKSPADVEENPLGLDPPDRLDNPRAFINLVFELLAIYYEESGIHDSELPANRDKVKRALQEQLYSVGIRAACLVPIGECLASFPEVWPVFTDFKGKTNEKQMQLVCAAALRGLATMTANGAALRHYKEAGISAEGIARLSAVATRQIDKLIALADALLTTAGNDMAQELMPACLFRTGLENAVDTETLIAVLHKARWLKPVAQAIATSWEAALAALGAEPVSMPAGSTLKQMAHLLSEHVRREAPLRFAQMLQKELAAPTLLAVKRAWQERTWMERTGWERRDREAGSKPVFKMLTHEGIELLFQIQCDQLRQYCEQLLASSALTVASPSPG